MEMELQHLPNTGYEKWYVKARAKGKEKLASWGRAIMGRCNASGPA